MSRTIRRPGVEYKSSPKSEKERSRVANRYTEVAFYVYTGNGHSGFPVMREPTKIERFKRYQELHLDGHHHHYQGMKAWERRIEQKRHRAVHRNLIQAFLLGQTEDVVQHELPRYPNQYW